MRIPFRTIISIILVTLPALLLWNCRGSGDHGSREIPFSDGGMFLEDRSGTLDANSVLETPGFLPLGPYDLNHGYTKSTYWIRLNLNQQANHPGHRFVELPTALLSHVELFLFQNGNLIDQQEIHRTEEFGSRKIQTPGFAFRIQLPPGPSVLLVKVKSDMDMILAGSIYSPLEWGPHRSTVDLWFGMYYGILLVMGLYNFFLFLSLGRDPVYFHYSTFIGTMLFSQMAYFGHGFAFLWPTWPWFEMRAVQIFMSIYLGFSGNEFLIHYFRSSPGKGIPRFIQFLRGLQVLFAFAFLASLVLSPRDSVQLFPFLSMLEIGTVISLSFYSLAHRFTPAIFPTISLSMLLVFGVIAALRSMGIFPYNPVSMYGVPFASAIETVLLSFGLAYRIRLLDRNLKREESLSRMLKEKQASLEEAVEVANRANEAKSDFLANMSHELRTPLYGVIAASELLEGSDLDSQQEKITDVLSRNSQLLMHIINNILDYSRIEAKEFPLNPAPVQLRPFLESTLASFSLRMKDRPVELKLELDPQVAPTISMDPMAMQLLLNNLVGNSVKFTERGHITVKVFPLTEKTIAFEVSDSGPGIPADRIENLFQKFSQINQSKNKRYAGSGLGLAISQELASLMGGKIAVESQVGIGSVFRLEIPYMESFPDPEAERTNPMDRMEKGQGPGQNPLLGLEILIIEDNVDIHFLLGKMLEKLDVTYKILEDGFQAETVVRQVSQSGSLPFPWKMILMDIQLPGRDGIETTRILRSIPGMDGIPIIGMTASLDGRVREQCLGAGMTGFLYKPFKIQGLREILTTFSR